jgi:hypothetical protein
VTRRENYRDWVHIDPHDVISNRLHRLANRGACGLDGFKMGADRVKKKGPRSAGRFQQSLMSRVGVGVGDHLIGEPIWV